MLAFERGLHLVNSTLGRHKESLALQHSMEGGADVQSLSQTALSLLKTMHLDNSIERTCPVSTTGSHVDMLCYVMGLFRLCTPFFVQ